MVLGMEPIDVVWTDDDVDAELDVGIAADVDVDVDTCEAGLEVVPT